MSFVTPWSGSVEEGTYEIAMLSNIKLGADTYNFKNWEDLNTSPIRTINLVSDMTIEATYEMVIAPLGKGYLQVHAILDSTEIEADGLIVETGQTFKTPATIEVNPGTYVVRVTYPGMKPYEQVVSVLEGQTLRVDAQFAVTPTIPLIYIGVPVGIGIVLSLLGP